MKITAEQGRKIIQKLGPIKGAICAFQWGAGGSVIVDPHILEACGVKPKKRQNRGGRDE